MLAVLGLCCVLIAAQPLTADELALPPFPMSRLISRAPAARSALSHTLSDLGLIAITEVPGLAAARLDMFRSLQACHISHAQVFESSILDDGTRRDALATETKSSESRSFDAAVEDGCTQFTTAASRFRSVMNEVTGAFVTALDNAEKGSSVLDLQTEGQQLEHFLVYTKNHATPAPAANNSAIDVHVDEGVLIALTQPLFFVGGTEKTMLPGLVIRMKSGELRQVKFPDDSVVFMVGDGLARWMQLPQYKAVPHALQIPNDVTRLWYGRMLLPPPGSFSKQIGLTFDFYRQMQLNAPSVLGCMTEPKVQEQASCNKSSEFHCWMRCYKESDLPQCDMEQPVVCLKDSDASPCEPESMGCHPRCGSAPVQFCDVGGAMTMFMDGFASPSRDTSCVIFLFQGWVMDTDVKFVAGCFGTLALGVFAEGCIKLRRMTKDNIRLSPRTRQALDLLLFGIQAMMGYVLMLLAMTYSTPMFVCVLIGLVLGHLIFNLSEDPRFTKVSDGATPCCEGLEYRLVKTQGT